MSVRNMIIRAGVAALTLLLGAQAFAARTTTYLHNDALGSVVAATNESGQVLWRKDYAPFGEQIDTTPDKERQSFTGKQHDDVIGLTNFGARQYDPEIGRFLNVDPVGFVEEHDELQPLPVREQQPVQVRGPGWGVPQFRREVRARRGHEPGDQLHDDRRAECWRCAEGLSAGIVESGEDGSECRKVGDGAQEG